MPLDAVCLRAVVQELEPSLPGMRSFSRSGAERGR